MKIGKSLTRIHSWEFYSEFHWYVMGETPVSAYKLFDDLYDGDYSMWNDIRHTLPRYYTIYLNENRQRNI